MSSTPRSEVILIVEDDPNDLLLLRHAFQKAHVRQSVRVTRDGEEAIEYLSGTGPFQNREQFPLPCLVVLDMKLPKKNGLEVLQWLRQHDDVGDMPVVMLASLNENDEKEEALRLGVEAYRVKSVSITKLVQLAEEIREEAEDHCKDAKPCPQEQRND